MRTSPIGIRYSRCRHCWCGALAAHCGGSCRTARPGGTLALRGAGRNPGPAARRTCSRWAAPSSATWMSSMRCRPTSMPCRPRSCARAPTCACSLTTALRTDGLLSLVGSVTSPVVSTVNSVTVANSTVATNPVVTTVTTVTSPLTATVTQVAQPVVSAADLAARRRHQRNTPLQDGIGVAALTLAVPDQLSAAGRRRHAAAGRHHAVAASPSPCWTPACGRTSSQNYGARVLASIDVTNGGSGPVTGDPYGHGTHVTSIAAGGAQNLARQLSGIAPQANLVIVRAFDGQGGGRYVDVIAGLNWIVANQHKYNIRVAEPVVRRHRRSPTTGMTR